MPNGLQRHMATLGASASILTNRAMVWLSRFRRGHTVGREPCFNPAISITACAADGHTDVLRVKCGHTVASTLLVQVVRRYPIALLGYVTLHPGARLVSIEHGCI